MYCSKYKAYYMLEYFKELVKKVTNNFATRILNLATFYPAQTAMASWFQIKASSYILLAVISRIEVASLITLNTL